MGGVYDLGFDHPDSWPHGNRSESGEEVLSDGDDHLSSDYCVHDGQYFVRCTLPIPIIGTDEVFAFGPWGSMSAESASAYGEAERSGTAFEGCFSWLANILPGTGMEDFLPCDLYPNEDPTRRPLLHAHSGHPLADWQANGISFDQLLDIYAAAGNDIRKHLTDA